MSNGQPATQYTPGVPQQTQPVLQATTTSYVTEPKKNVRQIPGVKYFGIFTMIIAFLLCIMGIVAIVVEAKDSYVGDPIWTGVLFVLPTGVLGLISYWKRDSTCSNVSYLVMNIIACVISAHLVIYASANASRERRYYWRGNSNHCDPWPGNDYYWYYDYDLDECQFTPSSRIAVDSVIAVLAFIQFVLSIISLVFTCYGTCTCCYNCCRPSPPPAVIQYTAQNGTCQLMSVGAYQTPTAYPPTAYQPVSLMAPAGQPGQVASQNFVVVPGQHQSQPVFVPATPGQVTLVQQPQPMNTTPAGSVVNPAAPTAPTANGATVTEEKPGKPSESSKPQDEPPNISYGQTASEQFHDQRNLLETV